MRYVELVGPPGVGKSTVAKTICSSPEFSYVRSDFGNRLVCIGDYDGTYESKKVPSGNSYKICNKIKLISFLTKNDCFTKLVEKGLTECRDNDYMFASILSSGAAYEIYSNKVNKGREVIFDQLFVTNILSVLWRMGKYSDSVIEYLVRAMPVPDLVIYISASPSVCVGRQKSRGRVQTSKYNWCSNIVDEQILYNGICDKMVNDLRKITSVKEVSNEGDLCNTKDKIKHIIQ